MLDLTTTGQSVEAQLSEKTQMASQEKPKTGQKRPSLLDRYRPLDKMKKGSGGSGGYDMRGMLIK